MHRLAKAQVAYFDYAATTPTDERVVQAMTPYWGFDGVFGNPSSVQHSYGTAAAQAVGLARRQVAKLIGARQNDIIWTSGATEANNLAIKGYLRASGGKCRKLITVATEHAAVLDAAKAMRAEQIGVEILPVSSKGFVDLEKLEQAVAYERALVSVMWVNNETGLLQPIDKIAKICRKYKAALHVDAAQALGKTKVNLKAVDIDMLSMSGHKIYGPKGIGALYVRSKTAVSPLVSGGGQEKGFRPGTLPVPLIVGMGKACEIMFKEQAKIERGISTWHDKVLSEARKIGNAKVNGDLAHKVPHILNIRFDGFSRDLVSMFKRVALSSGAACTTAKVVPSHVLRALGLTRSQATSSMRISFGRYTTTKDIAILIQELKVIVGR